jgi:hypothetical protein
MTNLIIVEQYCCTTLSRAYLHVYAQTLSNIIVVQWNSFLGKHYYCSTLFMQNSQLLIVAKLFGVAN